ncbi:Glycine-rich RNA-binding protein 2, mitochondrial [Botryosphaeria dothidea]
MTRVLLTGGSGFIAAHVLDTLLKRGHSVVTTVRSQDKANKIKEAHPSYGKDKLDFSIVEDIAQEGAFDQAVKSDPPFEAVIHTASPFHFNVTDVQKQLLDPAIIGTTGILKSIKKSAPTVKRVVITSSFAAIVNPSKGTWPDHTYSESDWNPLTHEEALKDPANGYRASKTFAERAAWEFLEKEKPNFTIATINPPFVFGPIVHYLNSLDALNTSNQRIGNFILGKFKDEIPPTGTYIWIDVRDLALGHVKAIELPEADNKRFFFTSGYFSNKELLEIIRKNFPEYKDKLPGSDAIGPGVDYPAEGVYKIDNKRTKEVLGIEFTPFEKTVVDTVNSLKAVGA